MQAVLGPVGGLPEPHFGVISENPQPIFCVGSDLRLSYFNPAWFALAAQNGAASEMATRYSLGASLVDAMSGPLKESVITRLRELLLTASAWHHEYECSSATHYRRYAQSVYPMSACKGLLFVNSMVVELPRETTTPPEDNGRLNAYVSEHGIVAQCCYCRRFRRAGSQPEVWDAVLGWKSCPPDNTSHGMCHPCAGFYFRQIRERLPAVGA